MTTVTNAWRVPAFRRVWGAGAASALGAEIGELAVPVLAVVTLGASASELSFVRAALLTPYLVLTLALGVLVDRVRRRPLMIGADLARGLLLVAVCVLAVSGQLTVPMLVVAAALIGSLTVLYTLADFSFLPLVVEDRALIDANARITATQSVIGVAGSGAGGLLVQALTAPVAIALNALGYLLSGALLGRVRVPESRRPRAPRGTALAELKVGLAALSQHRILRALVAEAGLWNFGNEILLLAVTVLVLQTFGWGPVVLGTVIMAVGVGAAVGSALSQRLTLRFGYGRSLVVAMLVGNTAPLAGVVGVREPSWPALAGLTVAFVVSGVGIGVANSQAVSLRQLAVVPELRGRVNATYRLASWGSLSIGALVGGVLVTSLGPWLAAVIGAVPMALASLPVVASPVRRMRRIEEVVPGEVQAAGALAESDTV
ncbi:MFS transporter [Cellulomonas dongxiuzhuiae]|uniref:MFS transporter n=1 Tax=Cellulomonas dongxiuzhuiae TaxID=2819979 RepID=A0ABX8GKH4_9CELL|nr:MFS transporter [Cellulomonas dongxiuzhuiae]MBO3095462.1 MFS transporter [Cellulomonas dongxiuzhuiae]QWC16443.1 MFS transporter [Cellulomonas dongxiuzhuiae]